MKHTVKHYSGLVIIWSCFDSFGTGNLQCVEGCGLEVLLVLCGLELAQPCPRHCICYNSPTTVSCQAHNFRTVPKDIPAHSERVFLQNNKIQQLLQGQFSPTTIVLWLYSNNISYIQPTTFMGFTRLEELDLGGNRFLKSLSAETFQGLGRLRALHLYQCGLLTLPAGLFDGLNNLQYLYLQDNKLEFLEDDMFIDLLNLSHLFLHGNRLWSLHQNTFRGLGTLDRLLLHQNRIQWIHQLAFHDLRRLTTLYLFNNSLQELEAETLATLPALEYLRLNDNPWECTCRILPLWEWLKRFRGSTSSVVCVTPPEFAEKDLKQMMKEDLPTCTGSEPMYHSKSSQGDLEVLPKKGHHHRSQLHHQYPHLNYWDQHFDTSLSTPSSPPDSGWNKNCTRQHGRRGKIQNEAHNHKYLNSKKMGGKHDPSFTGDFIKRQKNDCISRTSVGPPSGVQRATDRAHSIQAYSPLSFISLLTLFLTFIQH
ncbi:reticulon-4 receptor-like 1 [Trichomycterus rosablanca]|uniref:reticulon-4 receptor-like 1 n=1 Tax=Trichomycterus rosablanca TaxID=2290929 RepID=UPI002F357459